MSDQERFTYLLQLATAAGFGSHMHDWAIEEAAKILGYPVSQMAAA